MIQTILLRPLLTEKAAMLAESNRYAFVVASKANKIQIRQAIEARYPDVTISSVSTMVVRGKVRRQTTRKGAFTGRTTGYKKAVVTLASGSINFYENV